MIHAFSDALALHIGKKRDLVVASFSTTGPVERAATEIVLLDAMRAYFRYHLRGVCGIPRVTLLGTADDWRELRLRARNLTEYGIDDWASALLPVLDQLVATAEGAPDVAFWRRIYRTEDLCNDLFVDGWFHVLFPYLGSPSQPALLTRNAHMSGWRERSEVGPWSWTGGVQEGWSLRELGRRIERMKEAGIPDWDEDPDLADAVRVDSGPRIESFPSGLSSAPFRWSARGEERPMEFVGGFLGVTQHEDLSVQPVIGWAVREQPR